MRTQLHSKFGLPLFTGVVLILTAAIPIAAVAQESGQLVLEEIIVTAQKRQETLQDVPISVHVLGSAILNDASLDKIEEIQHYVPNLQMTESGISTQMYIRGIGTGNNQGFEQSVGMYIDGVYYGRQQLIRAPLFDLERIEVLRGPQGVLFGKNTIAGALNMTSAKPTDDFTGLLSLEGGDYGIFDAQAMVSGPLSDNVRGRLAVRYYEEDGYFTNIFRGRDETQREDVAIRGTLEWDPTDNLALSLKIESNQFDAVGRSISIVQDDVSIAPFPTAGLNFDQIFEFVLMQPDRVGDPIIDFNRRADAREDSQNDLTNITFTADYGLGDNTLTFVTGMVEYEIEETCDCDFIAGSIFGTLALEEYEQFSQEIRLTSPTGGNFEWIAGVFYQTGDLDYQDNIIIPPDTVLQFLAGGALASITDTSVHRDYVANSDLWAGFGQVTWNISDTVRLTLGGRYTSEDKDASRELNVWDNATQDITVSPAAPFVFLGAFAVTSEQTPGGHSLADELSESKFTPSASLQWDFSDNAMVYGSISTGFKSGGFDARANNPGSWQFLQEEVIAYEAGVRSTLWEGRAELNAAVFFTDYDDLQIAQFDGTLGFNVGNAAKTEVTGIEIDGRVLLTDNFSLGYALAYLDHEFTDFQNGNCYNRQTPDGIIGAQGNQLCDYTGFSGQYTPEFTSSLVFNYDKPFGDGMAFEFFFAYNYTSEQNVHVNLDPQYEIDGYTLLDARVGVSGERWSVAVLGKNLLDEEILTYVGNTPLSGSTFGTNTFYGFVSAPSTVTVQVTVGF